MYIHSFIYLYTYAPIAKVHEVGEAVGGCESWSKDGGRRDLFYIIIIISIIIIINYGILHYNHLYIYIYIIYKYIFSIIWDT